MINKNLLKYIEFSFLIILILGVAVYFTKKYYFTKNNIITDILFFSREIGTPTKGSPLNNKYTLSITLYDPKTKQIKKQKEFNLDLNLTRGDKSVQYDELSNSVYFSTGWSEDTPQPSNDSIYDFKINRANLNTGAITKIFSTKESVPSRWLLDKKNNIIYLWYSYGSEPLLVKKLNINTGNLTTIINQKNNLYIDFNKIQLSQDGKELFAHCYNTDLNIYIKYLCRIDLLKNKLTTNLVDENISGYNSISPDEKYLSFYHNNKDYSLDNYKLYIYDLQNQKTITVPLSEKSYPTDPVWSKDSKKIFFIENASLKYYDIDNRLITVLKNFPISSPNPTILSSSNNYLFYKKDNNFIIIDLNTKQDTFLTNIGFSLPSTDTKIISSWH